MKKRVLILGGLASDQNPQTEYSKQFLQLMPEHEFKEVRFDHLVFLLTPEKFSIIDGRSNEELSEYDLLVFRGKIRRSSQLAYIVSIYCNLKGLPFFNDYTNYRPSSKMAQAVFFYQQKVSFINTYYSFNPSYLKKLVGQQLTYPFILKDNYGAHGFNNYLVQSEEEFDQIIRENQDIQFIAQRYHKNDGDYRVLVMGQSKPLQIWRQSVGESHLNNTSQGGTSTLVDDLIDQYITDSQRLASNLNMTVAGVDLLRDSESGEVYFLEINSQPQLFTGAFVEEKAKLIESLFNSKLKP